MDSLKNHLEKINVLKAYETAPSSGLREILSSLQTKELMLIATELSFNYEKVDKDFLINEFLKIMQDKDRIENAMMLVEHNELEIFNELLQKDNIQNNFLAFRDTGYLQEKYIIFSFYSDGKIYFLIPDEIKEIYSKIDNLVFNKKYERYKTIHQYLTICLNLYGVLKKKKFVEIFNHYNEEKLNQKEFKELLDDIMSRQQPFFMEEDFIASDYYGGDNFEELDFLLGDSNGISYYLPPKDKFLKYEDYGYYEITPQLQRLKDYIIKNMCRDDNTVNDLIDDIELACSLEESFQSIIDELGRHKVVFSSDSQLYDIGPLVIDVYNNTRTWQNRGHTHYEAQLITGQPLPLHIFDNLYIPTKKGEKLLRFNQFSPCLCGSGKKYFRCCGQID